MHLKETQSGICITRKRMQVYARSLRLALCLCANCARTSQTCIGAPQYSDQQVIAVGCVSSCVFI